jgi:hypothetical protein
MNSSFRQEALIEVGGACLRETLIGVIEVSCVTGIIFKMFVGNSVDMLWIS